MAHENFRQRCDKPKKRCWRQWFSRRSLCEVFVDRRGISCKDRRAVRTGALVVHFRFLPIVPPAGFRQTRLCENKKSVGVGRTVEFGMPIAFHSSTRPDDDVAVERWRDLAVAAGVRTDRSTSGHLSAGRSRRRRASAVGGAIFVSPGSKVSTSPRTATRVRGPFGRRDAH
jgi:hypothetical protein